MAPSLEQRKDLLKTSGWQIADVVVWDGMRLIVFRPAANFFRPGGCLGSIVCDVQLRIGQTTRNLFCR